MKRKRVTIGEVAEAVGVSKATVSLALNRSPLVAQATKDKVIEAAERLGYQPNYFARRLSTGKSEIVGLYILRIDEQLSWEFPSSWLFYNPILNGVASVLSQNNYRLQLEVITFKQVQKGLIADIIQEGSLDGLLLLVQDAGEADLSTLADYNHFPLVTLNTQIDPKISSVKVDNEKAAVEVVRKLVDLNHTRIAFIGGPSFDENAQERRAGFLKTLAECKIDLPTEYLRCGDWQIESGRREMKELLQLAVLPTAVVVANDHMAIGAMQVCQEQGLNIPEDLSIIGFDNTELSTIITPKLTTVKQPLELMGSLAAEKVLKQIKEGIGDVSHTNLDTTIVWRESCR